MRRAFLALLALGLATSFASLSSSEPVKGDAQGAGGTARRMVLPQVVGSLSDLGYRPRFHGLDNAILPAGSRALTASAVSLATLEAMGRRGRGHGRRPGDGIVSVPHFTSSFEYQGQTFFFTMVGNAPEQRGARVETEIIPIRFLLPFVDASGQRLVLDASSKVANTLASPVFTPAPFDTGVNQFGNAMQRTAFWSRMGPRKDWFVHLDHRVRRTLDIQVPPESIRVFTLASGNLFAEISGDFLVSQLDTIFEVGRFDPDSLPIFLTYNTPLYVKDPAVCCVLGFHGAFLAGQHASADVVQTYAFADWNDQGLFSGPGGDNVADVHALSHEVAEWLNDPFARNVVPSFENGETGCSNLLETGDQLVGSSVPVDLNGFTYHPQTQDVLQFFSREDPSSALHGTYRFPEDPSVPNVFSAACTP